MKKIVVLILLQILILYNSKSQQINISSPLFKPLKSNLIEDRTGLNFDLNSSEIRLDLGSSPDFLTINIDSLKQDIISIGPDFHAFGKLYNADENVILQLDALDAFLGGHISYKKHYSCFDLITRFRIMHLSSHLVDGHFDLSNSQWRNNRLPVPFGREFLELTFCADMNNLKVYFGTNFIFRQRPKVLSKINYNFGFTYNFNKYISGLFRPYFSYSFSSIGIDYKYYGNNCIEIGATIGSGLDLFIMYYGGKSYYGEYYNESKTSFSFGFNFYF